MSIESALDKWAKTTGGKKALKAGVVEMNKRGSVSSTGSNIGGVGGAQHEIDFYVAEAKRIFKNAIEDAGFEFGDYLDVVNQYFDDKLEKWVVEMQFDPTRIQRPSLQPTWYPEGAYDIVALLNKGFGPKSAASAAKKPIRGYWPSAGVVVSGLKHRNGAFYIEFAAHAFNTQYQGEAQLQYDRRYTVADALSDELVF